VNVSVIMGTRPEAIKLAPVIRALKAHQGIGCQVCVTAQHREMMDQVLRAFDIVPDADLDLMQPGQTLAALTTRSVSAIDAYLGRAKPDMVLVQGDTTTVFSAALAAFYRHIAVGHVEAGLRTGNMLAPWPEEANRVLTARIADLHFAPTETSRQNLLREQVPDSKIIVTGNTVIDALLMALAIIQQKPPHIAGLPDVLQPIHGRIEPRVVLITGHRRENFGSGFENICRAVKTLANRFSRVHFVYPVHFNPLVREPVSRILGSLGPNGECRNIHLIDPLDYLPFVALMNRSCLMLTDSGGVQEEAPSLGKPVVVMRAVTERPEAVQAGTALLVGTDHDAIVDGVSLLLDDCARYEAMARAHNPYGDGHAAERVVRALDAYIQSRAAKSALQ
jgi:UDP-N-acetylglucosamine 2-epimerase (non-hydrolysing)